MDRFFILSGWTLLPAACIVVLSLFRADVKQAMLWSILSGGAVCLTVQGMEPGELFACLAFGYTPAPGAEILAGGGIRSMLQVAGIVLLSSSYSGIFDATDLLSGFGGLIRRLAERIGTFRAMTLASVPVSGISCNQTLATILTAQLCRPCYARRQDMAIPLENSAILIAALIPWSIAGSLPCATLGVTTLPEFLIWLEQGKMNRPGYAAAISMVLFVLMGGLAWLQIRIMNRNANL